MGRKKTKPEKPKKYEFNIDDDAIYVHGLYSNYNNQECKIIARSFSKNKEWYKIRFLLDDFEILTSRGTLEHKEDI
jgi:hypothetical protein